MKEIGEAYFHIFVNHWQSCEILHILETNIMNLFKIRNLYSIHCNDSTIGDTLSHRQKELVHKDTCTKMFIKSI